MHLLLLSFLLFCLTLSVAVPSPQWLYEQIHALPDGDTTELHTKKSNIPEDKNHAPPHKRKDGVKKLFNFLDSAIQESGSGSGESSSQEKVAMDTEKHSNSIGKQFSGTASSKQQDATSSSDNTQERSEETKGALIKEDQTSNTNKAGLTGYSRQGSNALSPGSNSQNTQEVIQYATANQQGGQRGIVTTPQRTAGYVANASSQSLAYSTNTSPYARYMKVQKATNAHSLASQRAPPYGYTASRRRPPAIPVRSRVATGSPQRPNFQGPIYTTTTVMGPNQYGSYFATTQRVPVSKGKSSDPLQEKAYGQLKRQRDQFHQQTRALIPVSAPVIQPYYRFPNPPPASLSGQVRAAIQPHFPYQRPNFVVSRARMPALRRIVTSPPNLASLPEQVYYRNAIPQQQASFTRLAHSPMGSFGYPLIKQARIGRAVNNRKPQPRALLTSLTAAAARLVVPARPEPYDNSLTAESVWPAAAPRKGAHAVRSTTHPGNV